MGLSPLRRAVSRALVAALLGSYTLAAAPAPVFAQDAAAIAKAREQFRQGLSLEAAGDFARALKEFKEVAVVKSTPQVRFHIAVCQEKTGDLVQALGSYRLALHEAHEAKAADVEGPAQEALAALEPRVPQLTLIRGSGAKTAEVILDGVPLGATSVGPAMPLNPGPHQLKAMAPQHIDMNVEFSLTEGEKKEIKLKLEEAPVVAPPPSIAPPPDQPAAPEPKKSNTMRTAGFIVGGTGIVGLGLSAVFFGLRGGAISSVDSKCGADRLHCAVPQSAVQSDIDSGKTMSAASTATFIIGLTGVAMGGGLVLLSSSAGPKANKEKRKAELVLAPGAAGANGGMSLVGRF
jgi:hypothetical protein